MLKKIISAVSLICTVCGCEKIMNYSGLNGRYFPPASYAPLTLLTTGMSATMTLGSSDPSQAGTAGTTATLFSQPSNVTITYDQVLTVSMQYRVGVYRLFPTVNQESLDLVVGQAGPTGTSVVGSDDVFFGPPGGLHFDGVHVWIADPAGQRIMSYSPPPTTDGAAANFALNQPSPQTSPVNIGCARNQMMMPTDVKAENNKLFVLDSGNNRLLIYNTIPTATGALPDVVVGQTSFTACTPFSGANIFATPESFWTDGTRLLVADSGNNRVLVFNTIPTSSGASADYVLGQPNFTSTSVGAGAQGMSAPTGVTSNGVQIFVADRGNHRVLVFNSFPTSNHPAADLVIGQSSFLGVLSGTDAASFNQPSGVAINDVYLVVADKNNNRVQFFQGN